MFNRLMDINEESFTTGYFDVAYHALMAALHHAQKEGNETGLSQVAATAKTQIAWIDAHSPEYHHSTAAAKARGNDSIFLMLAKQATTRITLLRRAQSAVTTDA